MTALILAILITLLDQWSKQVVRIDFMLGESRPLVDGFFSLTYLRNTGAAWGMLGGANDYLTIFSLVMLFILVLYRKSFLSDTRAHRVAFGLMLGGIIGNLIDRFKLGYVTDFLDFQFGSYSFPSFNVADAAICVGGGIYVGTSLFMSRHPLHMAQAGADDTSA